MYAKVNICRLDRVYDVRILVSSIHKQIETSAAYYYCSFRQIASTDKSCSSSPIRVSAEFHPTSLKNPEK
jgi:hypothetical protein